jgi:Cu2+-exporting ATPase
VRPLAHCEAPARALETASEHPVARALVRHTEASPPSSGVAERIATHPGRGVEGVVDGVWYRLGTRAFCDELADASCDSAPAPHAAATVVYLVSAGAWLAQFELADTLKPGAADLVRSLEAMGKRVHLLSGDAEGPVRAIARSLGIASARSEADPAAKQAFVAALQQAGAIVAMVGDGVNDAPVLAQANVAVALGTGADIAQTRADAVLLAGDPGALAEAFDLAQATLRVIRQNLVWAAIYNLAAVPAAAAGLVTPWMAGIGMSGSSLAVVLNALRLRRRGAPGRREG